MVNYAFQKIIKLAHRWSVEPPWFPVLTIKLTIHKIPREQSSIQKRIWFHGTWEFWRQKYKRRWNEFGFKCNILVSYHWLNLETLSSSHQRSQLLPLCHNWRHWRLLTFLLSILSGWIIVLANFFQTNVLLQAGKHMKLPIYGNTDQMHKRQRKGEQKDGKTELLFVYFKTSMNWSKYTYTYKNTIYTAHI